MQSIRSLIHKSDPYRGFDASAHPCEVRGWNNHSDMFAELAGNAHLIVEVGSWLGASAIAMAAACPFAHIVCVDTWLGSIEMWRNQADPERYEALKIRNGYPQIYYDFLANVVRAGLQERITPFPVPSTIALKLIREWGFRPDLIYVDGSHDEADVVADIQDALKLNPRVLCGDDYTTWTGVTNAVNRILPTAKKNSDGFWWI